MIRGALTRTLWPVPTVAIVVAIGLGIGLPALDRALQDASQPLAYVFSGGPSAARTLLSAIATSLISVTTLLFSLTIVTLQLASSQYTPRLLQTFVRDRVVQLCLAVLLGTFVYALTVLRTVRSAGESEASAFVPRLSVTVAFLLTLASVAALVTYLSHQTRQLRVETMMRDVHVEASTTLRRLADEMAADDQPDAALPDPPEWARPVLARHSGFLAGTAEAGLVAVLAATGTVLRLVRRPGDPVIAGAPVGWAWCDDPGGRPAVDELAVAVERHLRVGYERADTGDPSYGLRKLVDIAVRALSPGINDPTTAVHALSHVADLLGLASGRDSWHRRVPDKSGRERLLLESWDFAALLDLAVTQPRHYGGGDPTIVERLFALLAEAAWQVPGEHQRSAVRRQRDLLVAQFGPEPPAGRTEQDIRRWAADVDSALSGGRAQLRGPPAT